MSPESRLRSAIRTVRFMLVVTFACISAVAFLHAATRDLVLRNASLHLRRAIRQASGLPPLPDARAVDAWYTKEVTHIGAGTYRVLTDGGPIQVVVRSGAGLWGRITAVLGWTDDAVLTGVTFTEQVETPGLGARISEPWFQEQFRGKRGPFRLVAEGTRSSEPGTMDAITGATITSAAVRDILNAALGDAAHVVSSEVNAP